MKFALVGVLLIVASTVLADEEGDKPTPAPKAPSPKPTKPPTCPKQGKDFYVQIKTLGQGEWTYDMTKVDSQAFQDVREKLYDCVLDLYADYDYYQDLIVLSIENATSGFIPGFAFRFTKEGDGHVNRLSQAVQAGKLCDMEVAPKFIQCTELDQTMLYPMANCPAPCNELNCWPSCDASCCQQVQEQTIYLPVAPPAPPPPPPAAPVMCAPGCPETCAPSCSPSCCFVQKRMFAKQKQQPRVANAVKQPYLPPGK